MWCPSVKAGLCGLMLIGSQLLDAWSWSSQIGLHSVTVQQWGGDGTAMQGAVLVDGVECAELTYSDRGETSDKTAQILASDGRPHQLLSTADKYVYTFCVDGREYILSASDLDRPLKGFSRCTAESDQENCTGNSEVELQSSQ